MSKILLIHEDNPVKKQHITFSIREDKDEIVLSDVSDVFYPHPDAPEHCLVQMIEKERIISFKRNDIEAAPLFLLKNALDNISIFLKNKDRK